MKAGEGHSLIDVLCVFMIYLSLKRSFSTVSNRSKRRVREFSDTLYPTRPGLTNGNCLSVGPEKYRLSLNRSQRSAIQQLEEAFQKAEKITGKRRKTLAKSKSMPQLR